jgi:hypothetical protein
MVLGADARWHQETTMPPSDLLTRAVAAGVMFTEPRRALDHDGWIQAARQGAAAVTAREAGSAFLASLTSGRMDLRSALASYALVRHLPEHPYAGGRWRGWGCQVCGIYQPDDGAIEEDLNDRNQGRFGWGGMCGYITYAAFDLEQFARAPRLEPTAADISLGQEIIDHLRQLPPRTTAAQAARTLTMLPGTRDQREVLMDMLGITGILHSPGHPGYADAFIPATQSIDEPSQRFTFGSYPTCWWKAEGGISDSALRQFLPDLH